MNPRLEELRRDWLDEVNLGFDPDGLREKFGITEEQYVLFHRLMRLPVYEWQILKWTPCTVQHNQEHRISESADAYMHQALDALRKFLSQNPNIPIAGLRALIEQVTHEYYIHNNQQHANQIGKLSACTDDTNVFMDEALRFFQEASTSGDERARLEAEKKAFADALRDATDAGND
jgi:hypothetical protein